MSIDGSAEVKTPLAWTKSSYSSNEGGACVEIATTGRAVLVRDSKNVSRPHLTVGPTSWAHFVRYANEMGRRLRRRPIKKNKD